MKLRIAGFRCYTEAEFNFPSADITLLAGGSGAGKSTIFQAIRWCLYGKVRNVYPKKETSGPADKCEVKLTLNLAPPGSVNEFTVQRQKKPDRVTVIYDGHTWTDTVAQDLIIQTFGDEKFWISTSYIQQLNRCLLLSGSQKEKLTVLKKISLGDDNPDEYIQVITQKAREIESSITAQRAVYEREVETYGKLPPVTPESLAAIPNFEQYLTWKSTTEVKLRDLHQKLLQYREYKGQLEQLKRTMAAKTTRLFELSAHSDLRDPDSFDAEIAELESRIVEISTQINIRTELKHLEQDITNAFGWSKLSETDDLPALARMSETEIRTKTAMYAQGKAVCTSMGCDYSTEAITDKLKQLQERLQLADKAATYRGTQARIAQLRALIRPVAETKSDAEYDREIAEVKEAIRQAQLSRELLTCPDCSATLRLLAGKLAKVADAVVGSTDADILKLNQRLHKLQSDKTVQAGNVRQLVAIKELETSLGDQSSLASITDNPSELRSQIFKLQPVKVIEAPPSITESQIIAARQILDHRRNISELQSRLKPELDISFANTESMRVKQTNLRMQRDHQIRVSSELNRLTAEIANLEQQEVKLSSAVATDPETEYQTTRAELENLNKFLSDINHAKHCVDLHSRLEQDRQRLEALYTDLASLNNLKATAIKVEYQQLDDTVNVINVVLEETLEKLFDEPIQATMSMFKTLKTGGRVKPEVNLNILYRGVEYDSVSQMSGGEGDRVSLAVIMALGMVSNAKLLLLDECLSSLNSELREAAVKMIRKYNTTARTVVMVDHESVEGLYGKVVRVKYWQ